MLTSFLITGAVIALSVIIHYEFLYQFTKLMPKLKIRHRVRVLFGVFAALAAHTLEVLVYGATYYLMDGGSDWGSLKGNFDGTLFSAVYFSFTAFTTLGLGDIEPTGNMRLLVGIESLAGFLLITWSASFLFLEMTRYWDRK